MEKTITDRTLRNDLNALKNKGFVDNEGKGPKTKWHAKKSGN